MRSGDGDRRVRQQSRAADYSPARPRRRANECGSSARIAGSLARVRASSPRLSSESGSAHSCSASPNPFGACGDHTGCRSCRRSTGAFGVASLRAERAQHGDEPVLRRAELSCVLAPGLGIVDERARHGFQIAVGRSEDARDAIDGGCRRFIAHEVRDQLGGDELRRRWMTAQRADRPLAFLDAGLGCSAVPSTVLVPGSCSRSMNANSIGPSSRPAAWRARRDRAADSRRCSRAPGPFSPLIVQPVRIFASSCTSCCV